MPTGTIRITATQQGKRLSLLAPNPSPPPEKVETWGCDPIPGWVWEIVAGNAGETCTITTNAEGEPTLVAVG